MEKTINSGFITSYIDKNYLSKLGMNSNGEFGQYSYFWIVEESKLDVPYSTGNNLIQYSTKLVTDGQKLAVSKEPNGLEMNLTNNKNDDPTIAKEPIPKAGFKVVSYGVCTFIVIAIGMICYGKYKCYKDV